MKVCITGGIGSGKSTVCDLLKKKGYFVVSADEINGELLTDKDYLCKLRRIFPDAVTTTVDRAAIRREITENNAQREALNALAHREIMNTMMARCEGRDLCFCEVPLLTTEYAGSFDRIWYVDASEKSRIERIIRRDGKSEDEARKFIGIQKEYEVIKNLAHDIIHNDDLKETERKVCVLLESIK